MLQPAPATRLDWSSRVPCMVFASKSAFNAGHKRLFGVVQPHSQFLSVLRLTSSCVAMAACVRPRSKRRFKRSAHSED
jgi:hypothetical protein